MRRNIRVKELYTPCAGLRPGAADPTRSKAAYPPPRLVPDEESRVLISDDLSIKRMMN